MRSLDAELMFSTFRRAFHTGVEQSKPYLDKTQSHCNTMFVSAHKTFDQLLSQPHAKEFAYIVVLAIFLLLSLTTHLRGRSTRSSRPSTPTLEKARSGTSTPILKPIQGRKPGHWPPSDFRTPTPPPYPDWSIEHTKPLPYRPFKYGPKYFQTMGLRNVNFHDWIELDNHFPRFHADKKRRIEQRGSKCCKTAPDARDAAMELLDELREYLPARYPALYRKTDEGVENLWSGEHLKTLKRPLSEDPMAMAARMVQDDLAIMIERPDGQYYLLAGAILLPGFWRLEDKFGMVLSEIHTSGDVPQFREKLEKGMMNFFRRIKPEELIARNNYFLQVDDDLAWSYSIGDEDEEDISWNTAEKNKAIEHHYFRSERQTLRRLPRSGGVVFTIRTYFERIEEICKEAYVPGRLASAVRSWGEDVSRYKGRERYGDVLLEYLDKRHESQVEGGLEVDREDEVRTYPW